MIARFAGLALTCDVCGDQYVDLAESAELGAALDALACVMASASVDGWTVAADRTVACPRHGDLLSVIVGSQQTGSDLFDDAA